MLNKIRDYFNENPWIPFLMAASLGAAMMGLLTTSVVNGVMYFAAAVLWAWIQTKYNP